MANDSINNRYLVFAGDSYYARGGMLDFHMATDDIEADGVKNIIANNDWAHVYDMQEGRIIKQYYKGNVNDNQ